MESLFYLVYHEREIEEQLASNVWTLIFLESSRPTCLFSMDWNSFRVFSCGADFVSINNTRRVTPYCFDMIWTFDFSNTRHSKACDTINALVNAI